MVSAEELGRALGEEWVEQLEELVPLSGSAWVYVLVWMWVLLWETECKLSHPAVSGFRPAAGRNSVPLSLPQFLQVDLQRDRWPHTQ